MSTKTFKASMNTKTSAAMMRDAAPVAWDALIGVASIDADTEADAMRAAVEHTSQHINDLREASPDMPSDTVLRNAIALAIADLAHRFTRQRDTAITYLRRYERADERGQA